MSEFINSDLSIIEQKNPLVIYHGNCADGFSAAWVFHFVHNELGVSFDFHKGIYGETPPDCSNRVVFLVDFSYKREVVKQICDVAIRVVLIDHHKTAIEDLAPIFDTESEHFRGNFEWYTDVERSGAMLAWDYWNNCINEETILPYDVRYKSPPLLLDYVQDRDLWKFKLPESREVSATVISHEYSFKQWDELMLNTTIVEMASSGRAIERKHHKDIKELLNVCQHLGTIGGYVVPVANLPYTLASDACHKMASAFENGKVFAATYYDTGVDRIYSLRSCDNGMDVSEIAKSYGGGGHRHAAGFKVPLSRIRAGEIDG